MPEGERGLNDKFMADLKKGGLLEEVTNLVKRDLTLDFQIRRDQVHIYYRGGKIWDINWNSGRYKASFDKGYCRKKIESINKIDSLPPTLSSKPEVNLWIETIPFLKQTMDEYFSENEGNEREYQQHVVKENNQLGVANGTDYFIVDVEYKERKARFDMVAFFWPSEGSIRKIPKGYRPDIAIIEMKFGDKALKRGSGLKEHVNDVDTFLADQGNFRRIREEMVEIFKQKRELELVKGLERNANPIETISDNKPEFILLLAAHDPASRNLESVLAKLKTMEHADLKIATANFTGYSLYRQAMYDLTAFKKMFSNRILKKK